MTLKIFHKPVEENPERFLKLVERSGVIWLIAVDARDQQCGDVLSIDEGGIRLMASAASTKLNIRYDPHRAGQVFLKTP
jgi:hypothetical protein